MGRSTTPRYRMVMDGAMGASCWHVKRQGRPTEANLKKYVEAYNVSLRPGGVNQHLAKIGVKPAMWARIEFNCMGGGTVCTVKMPAPTPDDAGAWWVAIDGDAGFQTSVGA